MRWLALLPLAACGRIGFEAADDAAAMTDAPAVDSAARVPTDWIATTSLPAPRELTCAVMAKGFAYVIGGDDETTVYNDVVAAPVLADGTLGAWTAQAPAPNPPPRWHACAFDATSSSLYLLGGSSNNAPQMTVRRAHVESDGRILAWTTEPPLPAGRRGLSALVEGGVLYAIGGEVQEGFVLADTVFRATIAADGALAPWTAATSLPTTDYMFGAAAANGRFYKTGGYMAGATALVATPGGDWVETTPLPSARERHASVVLDGYLYAIGGAPMFNGLSLADTLRAPLQADGTLGAWSPLSELPLGLTYATAAAYDGRLYVFAGSNDTSGSSTLTAQVLVRVPPP